MRHGGVPQMRLLVLLALAARGAQACTKSTDCSGHSTCHGYDSGKPKATTPVPATQGTCACTGGWTGTTCGIDPCTGYDCGHGTCSGNKQCTCHAGYVQDGMCKLGVKCTDLPDAPKETKRSADPGHFGDPDVTYTDCPKTQLLFGGQKWKCDTDGVYENDQGQTRDQVGGLSCKDCPDILHCQPGNLSCKQCSWHSWKSCTSECARCDPGYTDGDKHECNAVGCNLLDNQLSNGKVTYSVTPPVYSGPSGTTATLTCDTGYGLSYDGIKVESQQPTTCKPDMTWTNFDETAHSPSCIRTCAPDAQGKNPCASDGNGVAQFSKCDGGSAKKFRCSCRQGWYGETCSHDVNECQSSEYPPTGHCKDSRDDINDPTGSYGLGDGLKCTEPYWVNEEGPSGCDHDASKGKLTQCYNFPGSWTCGKCSAANSCCTAETSTLPKLHDKGTPWHYPNGENNDYLKCDAGVAPVDGGTVSPACNTACAAGCIGSVDSHTSSVAVDYSAGCDKTKSCLTGTMQLISINPLDANGRKTAETPDVTTKDSFSITVSAILSWPVWNDYVTEGRTKCSNPPVAAGGVAAIAWQGSSKACSNDDPGCYEMDFTCTTAGIYTIHTLVGGGDVMESPVQIKIVAEKFDPSSTLAFLVGPLDDSPGEWCDDPGGGSAPRCRTKKGEANMVFVIVRDQYGNPLPKAIASAAAVDDKIVTWSTTGDNKLNPFKPAVWKDEQYAYEIDFTFTDPHAFEFLLEIRVGGNPWKIDFAQDVWKYPTAQLPDQRVPLWSTTRFSYPVFTSLNVSACEAYACDQSYLNPVKTVDKRCSVAVAAAAGDPATGGNPGCLFHTGLDAADTNWFSVYADWGSSDESANPTVQVELSRVCTGLDKGDTNTRNAKRLYWLRAEICDDSGGWNYTNRSSNPHWKPTAAVGNNHDIYYLTNHEGPSSQPKTLSPTGTWLNQSYSGTIGINSLHPGLFRVHVKVDPQDGRKPFEYTPELVSVGPGPVSPSNTRLRLQYIDVIKQSGATRGSPAFLNAGFDHPAGSDGFQPKLRLQVEAHDKDENPRIGRDEVVIGLSRPHASGNDHRKDAEINRFLGQSETYQVPSAFTLQTWATAGICGKDGCREKYDTITLPYGKYTGGTYELAIDPSLPTPDSTWSFGHAGVYQLSAWICGTEDDLEHCKSCPFDGVLQFEDKLECRAQLIQNFTSKPTLNFTVCPQNTEVPRVDVSGRCKDFKGFDVYTTDQSEPACVNLGPDQCGQEDSIPCSRGLLNGPSLADCKCLTGFSGDRSQGSTCYACPVGRFQSTTGGAGSCSTCDAGSICGCSSQNIHVDSALCKSIANWAPACTKCDLCPERTYQNEKEQSKCNPCETDDGGDGFFCPQGAAYPIAKPGYWVSAKLTTKGHNVQMKKCSLPPDAKVTGLVTLDVKPQLHACTGVDTPYRGCTVPHEYAPWNIVHNKNPADDEIQLPADDKTHPDQPHGTAWCPGSPLIGWTKVDSDSFTEEDAKYAPHYQTQGAYSVPVANLQSIDPKELAAWEKAWNPSLAPLKPLSIENQKGCWQHYHENGFDTGDQCLQIVGSRCRTGHKTLDGSDFPCSACCENGEQGGPGAKYPDCDGNQWFMAVVGPIAYCSSCHDESKHLDTKTTILYSFLSVIVVGVLAKFGVDLAQRFKLLKPPMMTLITFMQVVNLFTRHQSTTQGGQGLHWPAQWQEFTKFFSGLGSLLNFTAPPFIQGLNPFIQQILTTVQPRCLLVLPYWQRWILWMASPLLLFLALYAFYHLAMLLSSGAMKLQYELDLHTSKCEQCQRNNDLWEEKPRTDDTRLNPVAGLLEPEPMGVSRPASPSPMGLAQRMPGGTAVVWKHRQTGDKSDKDPRVIKTATFRLRNGDGRARWCNECKDTLTARDGITEPEKQLQQVAVSNRETVAVPQCLQQCLKKCPQCLKECTRDCLELPEMIPLLVAIAAAVALCGCIGWIVGTLLDVNARFFGLDLGWLGVGLMGSLVVVAIPLLWCVVWKALIGSAPEYNVRPCCTNCGPCGRWLKETVHASARSRQSSTSRGDTNQSRWSPSQFLNRMVLVPLSRSDSEQQWNRIISVWHFYLWFGYITIIGTAVEPLACRQNEYGSWFMTATGAQSIECSWCTGERDLQGAFPIITELTLWDHSPDQGSDPPAQMPCSGVGTDGPLAPCSLYDLFAPSNGLGLYGFFGLFSVPGVSYLRGYGLFACLSAFFTVFYFFSIPAYFQWRLNETNGESGNETSNQSSDQRKDRDYPYGFLTDKFREDCYYWEVNTVVRKGLLAMFSVIAGGHPIFASLANLLVMIAAVVLQFRYKPFAHGDINHVEEWSLISTVLVLAVGFGAQASGFNYADQSSVDWFNDLALVVLALHFVHTCRVLLNRLSQCVWMIRQDGGCACGVMGALAMGTLIGAVFGFVVARFIASMVHNESCKDRNYLSCHIHSDLGTAWTILATIISAVVFGGIFAYMSKAKWCRCCIRRGRSCCYILTICCSNKCTCPGYHPCCCAQNGCCNKVRMFPRMQRHCTSIGRCDCKCWRICITDETGKCDCKCCSADKEDMVVDSGDLLLDKHDAKHEFDRQEPDKRFMGDNVRRVLHKSKLELADIWANHGTAPDWDLAEVAAAEAAEAGAAEAAAAAEGAPVNNRRSKTVAERLLELALEQTNHVVNKDEKDGAITEVSTTLRRQKDHRDKLETMIGSNTTLIDDIQAQRMRKALAARQQKDAINLLRKQRQADLGRIMTDLIERREKEAEYADSIQKALDHFPDDKRWRRAVYRYLATEDQTVDQQKRDQQKRDQQVLINEVVNGMVNTKKQMHDELMLNSAATSIQQKLAETLSEPGKSWQLEVLLLVGGVALCWLLSSKLQVLSSTVSVGVSLIVSVTLFLAAELIDASDAEDPQAPAEASDFQTNSEPPDTEDQRQAGAPRHLSKKEACWQCCRKGCANLCHGTRKVFFGFALAGMIVLLLIIFNNCGCCKKTLSGLSDRGVNQNETQLSALDGCTGVTNETLCSQSWEDHYGLQSDSCENGDLQRGKTCRMRCKDGYVWSSGDQNPDVNRSLDFECALGDNWWNRMFTPNWTPISWIKYGPWEQGKAPNDTANCTKPSAFIDEQVCQPVQEHPKCWKDPCWSENHVDNPAYTGCGNNTSCERWCDNSLSEDARPNVSSPSPVPGAQQLCGVYNKSGVLRPYDYKYPAGRSCTCTQGTTPVEDNGSMHNEKTDTWTMPGGRGCH